VLVDHLPAQGTDHSGGPFYDKKPSVLAITGGTGAYANARGWMVLNSKAGGTQYDFVFHIS
jgi:hypothetical protein